jgi:hypothetical protein
VSRVRAGSSGAGSRQHPRLSDPAGPRPAHEGVLGIGDRRTTEHIADSDFPGYPAAVATGATFLSRVARAQSDTPAGVGRDSAMVAVRLWEIKEKAALELNEEFEAPDLHAGNGRGRPARSSRRGRVVICSHRNGISALAQALNLVSLVFRRLAPVRLDARRLPTLAQSS